MTKTKRKQTRRAISVKPETLEKLQAYAKEHGKTCSGLVEEWLAEALPREPTP